MDEANTYSVTRCAALKGKWVKVLRLLSIGALLNMNIYI